MDVAEKAKGFWIIFKRGANEAILATVFGIGLFAAVYFLS
jgi:hypothetical protein